MDYKTAYLISMGLNATLSVENSRLRAELKELKNRKWWQFWKW